jgi:hypothetical protein
VVIEMAVEELAIVARTGLELSDDSSSLAEGISPDGMGTCSTVY